MIYNCPNEDAMTPYDSDVIQYEMIITICMTKYNLLWIITLKVSYFNK